MQSVNNLAYYEPWSIERGFSVCRITDRRFARQIFARRQLFFLLFYSRAIIFRMSGNTRTRNNNCRYFKIINNETFRKTDYWVYFFFPFRSSIRRECLSNWTVKTQKKQRDRSRHDIVLIRLLTIIIFSITKFNN